MGRAALAPAHPLTPSSPEFVTSIALTVGGLALACVGLALTFNLGVALAVAGTVCFVAGALSGRDTTTSSVRRRG